MKRTRILPTLLLALLLLSGCGSAPAAPQSPPASSSAPAAPASSGETGDGGDTSGGPEDASGDTSSAPSSSGEAPADETDGPGDWRRAYLAELEGLCGRYGRYVREDESEFSAVTGVKYGQLLDFDGDGTRELVVLVDDAVRLYTCRAGQAELLHLQAVGGRYGQTDVSYTFLVNARSDTPCLVLFHTRDEWSQEAITLVEVSGGQAVTTELFASASRQGDLPDRAALDAFQIDGQPVSREEYEARRAAALEGAVEIDRDFGAFPATREQLDLLFATLAGEDGDYVLPNSDAAFLTAGDLAGLTPEALRLARNEIYARHGRSFQAQDLRDYFGSKDWYAPVYTPEEFDAQAAQLLNRYETANLQLIRSLETGSTAPAE